MLKKGGYEFDTSGPGSPPDAWKTEPDKKITACCPKCGSKNFTYYEGDSWRDLAGEIIIQYTFFCENPDPGAGSHSWVVEYRPVKIVE